MSDVEFLYVEKKNKNVVTKKLFLIISFLLLLLIPLMIVESTISERQSYRKEAKDFVASSWAGSQVLKLPIFKVSNKEKYIFLKINDLDIVADAKIEIRKKGIFKIPVYISDVKITGNFLNPDFKDINGVAKFGVKDAKGFVDAPAIKINGSNYPNNGDSSVNVNIKNAPKLIAFETTYKLKGSEAINFEIGAKSNKISVKSNWKDPSFGGDFLPTNRTVTSQGFEADWSVPKIALSRDRAECNISFLTPVDSYRMTLRTIKYGFLFLSLTFLAFFIFELISKKTPIHPFQYGLIGLSMIIFYLLLISISEIVPFLAAYLVAVLMTVSLIVGYSYFVLSKKNKKFAGLIAVILTLLYSYLYTILNLQDFSLLFGSFGLFFVILLVMYSTRNIDWYEDKE